MTILHRELRAVNEHIHGKRKYYLLARACVQPYESLFRAHDMWKLWEYAEVFADLNVPATHMLKRVREYAKDDELYFERSQRTLRWKLFECVNQLGYTYFGVYSIPYILKRLKALAINKPTGEMFEGQCHNFYRCVFGKRIDTFNELQRQLFFAGQKNAKYPAWMKWHDGLILKTAQQIYVNKEFSDLLILADMLEDAGVEDVDMLHHFRMPTQHCRGCWPLDLLIGKT